MKGNQHKRLYIPDYFGWHWYCDGAALRQKRFDKRIARKKARIARKKAAKEEP